MDSMKKTLFTDTMIRKLKPEETDYTKSEGNGFSIRVMPSGVKTWLYLYSIDGKRRKMNLGQYPDVTLETARGKFEDAKKQVKNGVDPMAAKEQAVDERRKAPTVADLVAEYIERHAKVFKRSWQDDERLLKKEVVAVWGKRKAADVKKRDVTLLLESIVDRGSPAMSNQVLKIVRKMFNFAVERDILQSTPCLGVKALAPNTRRERTLTESEIRTLWGSIDTASISDEVRRALKLVLLTGQRPGEVAGIHSDEIDGHWWTIPAARAKNGKEHRVYLTSTALSLLGDTTGKGFLFRCPHEARDQSIDPHALPVAVRRNLVWPLTDAKGKPLYQKDGKPATENKLRVDKFTPHDLRRTASTFMSELGFHDEVIDSVLNHVKKGVIGTYNRYKYDREKQQALESWERKLLSILHGSENNVIPITRAMAA